MSVQFDGLWQNGKNNDVDPKLTKEDILYIIKGTPDFIIKVQPQSVKTAIQRIKNNASDVTVFTGLYDKGSEKIDIMAHGYPRVHLKCKNHVLGDNNLRPGYVKDDLVSIATEWRVVGSYSPEDMEREENAKKQVGPGERICYGAARLACRVCEGKLLNQHYPCLIESVRTRHIATQIANQIMASRGDVFRSFEGVKRGFMLGVLIADGDVFVAISGYRIPETTASIMEGYGTVVVDVPSIDERRTAGGNLIGNTANLVVDKLSPAGLFECAAPKLLHHYLRKINGQKIKIWHMTEMWVGPGGWKNYIHGDAVPSCANCEQVIPILLCPSSGKESNVWQDVRRK